MAGQVWGTDSLGGYLYSDELSDYLRLAMKPLTRFQNFCDAKDASKKGLNKGDEFRWNIFSKIATAGAALTEGAAVPESNFTISRGSLTVHEMGNSIPWTGLLDNLSAQPVKDVISQVLKDDANEVLEAAAHAQFDATLLTVTAASGTSTSEITVEVTGTATATNDVELHKAHVKKISTAMKERNIPAYDGINYMCVARPDTYSTLTDDLEAISVYVDRGFGMVQNGEVGRYSGVRFFEQTAIASEGWTNSKSDAAYFFGSDTVAEAICIPVELRGKLPTNYGLSKGLMWYFLGGFGLIHNQTGAEQNRVVKWASAA